MTKGKARKQALLQSSSSSSSIRVFARMLLAAACCAVVFWSKLPAAAAVVTMQPVARINAGGAQYVDAQGNTWQDDAVVFYQNGGPMGEKRVVAGAVIQNTTNPTLYQSEHWWRRTKPGPFL